MKPKHNHIHITVLISLCVILTLTAHGAAATNATTQSTVQTETTQSDFPHLTDEKVTHHIVRVKQAPNTTSVTRTVMRKLNNTPNVRVTRQKVTSGRLGIAVNTEHRNAKTLTSIDNIKTISDPVIYSPSPDPDTNDDTIAPNTHNYKPSGEYTYGLKRMQVPEAWDKFNTKGDDVRIAIIDSGVNPSHPAIDLAGNPENNYAGGWAVTNDSYSHNYYPPTIEGTDEYPPTDDSTGHGTHTAGTATGGQIDGTHIGAAPNAELMVAKASSFPGYYTSNNLRLAVEWATKNDADIISLSLGGPLDESFTTSGPLVESIRQAHQNGITVVAASGNSGEDSASYIAGMHETIGVGATAQNGEVAAYSSGMSFDPYNYYPVDEFVTPNPPFHSEEDFPDSTTVVTDDWENPRTTPFIVAPGSSVWSADADTNGGTVKTGTSMATPHAAGVAALAYSNNPDMTDQELRTVLQAAAVPADREPNGYNTRQGYGEIDATRVLTFSDDNGYHNIDSIDAPNTALSGEEIELTTTITNDNIIDDTGQPNATLYVNGVKTQSLSDDNQLESGESQQFSATYNTTGLSGAVNMTITTADETRSQTVNIQSPQLNLSLSTQTITANSDNNVTATVTNSSTGEAVKGASVRVPSLNVSNQTGGDGETILSITPSSTGTLTVKATTDGYTDATTTLTVNEEIDNSPELITITTSPQTAPANTNTTVTITAVNAETNSPVEDAVVSIPELGVRNQTNNEGKTKLTIKPSSAGKLSIKTPTDETPGSSGQITVVPQVVEISGEEVPRTYTSLDGETGERTVTPTDALNAIDAYRNDELTPSETVAILNVYSEENE